MEDEMWADQGKDGFSEVRTGCEPITWCEEEELYHWNINEQTLNKYVLKFIDYKFSII